MNNKDAIYNFQYAYFIAWRLEYGAWEEILINDCIVITNIN
jgi:hypothetical protein